MPAERVARKSHRRPCMAMKRMKASSMPMPPHSRWAKWILPPPSWGQPVAARMHAHEQDGRDGRDEEQLEVLHGRDAPHEVERLGRPWPSPPRRPGAAAPAGAPAGACPLSHGLAHAGYDPRTLSQGSLQARHLMASATPWLSDAALDVDDEDVVPERALGRPGLDLGEVDVPVGELAQDEQQAAGLVLVDAAHEAGLVAAAEVLGRRLARHEHEAGGVVLGVLDVLGGDVALVHLGGEPRADGRPRPVDAAHPAHGLGGRVGGLVLHVAEVLADELPALPVGVRDADHLGHAVQRHLGLGDEHLVHRLGDLTHDVQVVEAPDEAVHGDGDGALERVLDGDDAERHLAGLHGAEHVGDGGIGEGVQPAVGHVREKRLLRERPFGPQERDPVAAVRQALHSSRTSLRSYPLGYQTTPAGSPGGVGGQRGGETVWRGARGPARRGAAGQRREGEPPCGRCGGSQVKSSPACCSASSSGSGATASPRASKAAAADDADAGGRRRLALGAGGLLAASGLAARAGAGRPAASPPAGAPASPPALRRPAAAASAPPAAWPGPPRARGRGRRRPR